SFSSTCRFPVSQNLASRKERAPVATFEAVPASGFRPFRTQIGPAQAEIRPKYHRASHPCSSWSPRIEERDRTMSNYTSGIARASRGCRARRFIPLLGILLGSLAAAPAAQGAEDPY